MPWQYLFVMPIIINSGTRLAKPPVHSMISRIKGSITEKTPSSVIVSTGGIGFDVLISGRTFEKLPDTGETAEMDIYTHVREDELRLVGFFNKEEKEIFEKDAQNGEGKQSVLSLAEKPLVGWTIMKRGLLYL